MTRSIFDPSGGETEHSGNRFTGPSADNDSHMPPSVVDGVVSDEEAAEQEVLLESDGTPLDRAIGQKDLALETPENENPPGTADDAPAIPPRRGNENVN